MQLDEDALDLLRKQLQADLDKTAELKRQNDLSEQALRQTQTDAQLRQIAERNRLKIALDTNEKVGGLANQWPEIILFIEGFREWQKEDGRWKDRVDEILLLLLTGRGNGNKARIDELKQELQREHEEKLLAQLYENLNELQEQAASYGAIDVPLKVVNQIKKTQKQINDLETKLRVAR